MHQYVAGTRSVPATSKKRRKRTAYTFVELIVVTLMIGILVALLLPAVQAAREAARRSNCSINLQQLIIAAHHYEMHHGVYPSGTINETGPIQSVPNGYHHNWLIQILPYFEERVTYDHVDRAASVYSPTNAAVRQMFLPAMMCPSQDSPRLGYGHYAGVHSDVETPIDRDNNGVFFLNSRVTYFDVKDGSSQTLFVGEKFAIAGDLGWMSGTRATLRNTGVRINVNRNHRMMPAGFPPEMIDDARGTLETMQDESLFWDALYGERRELFRPRSESFSQPPDAAFSSGAMGMAAALPSSEPEKSTEEPAPERRSVALAVGGFGSFHPGGAQFAFGDGSVRFVHELIDVQVYLQLGHRADDKLIQTDWEDVR